MSKYVVYNCVRYPGGGLADRFKGIVSCFALAKKLQREFIINWTYPYKLTTVLSPNKVNWLQRPIQGTHSSHRIFDAPGHNAYKDALQNYISFFKEDILIFETNVNFLEDIKSDELFSSLFNELFTYSFELPPSIKNKPLGVAARFGGQQADWNDPTFNRDVTYEDVYNSIRKYIVNDCPVFLCTDSSKFLNFCLENKLNYYTSKNKPEHIDYAGCSENGFKKAFEDFFILRECEPILSLKGNFAITAALSNNRKLIEI